jgi:2-oxoglutarate dehydrogenase E2 component (dihydrolipoamide succinyltransferase)
MATKILVPALGESVVEATVGHWLKQEGERVNVGEPLVELETDKVNLEVGAAQAGILARIERPQGADVHIGDVLGLIEDDGTPPHAGEDGGTKRATLTEAKTETTPAPGPQPSSSEDGKATPVAKRVASDLGVDVAQVPGSGPRGRVTKEDVLAQVEKQKPGPAAPVAPGPYASPSPSPSISENRRATRETRQRLTRRRRTIAQRLVEAQHTAAMLTTFNEIDMGAVMDIRARRKESFKEKHGIGLGFMSFFVKASIGALKAFPPINAELQGDELVLKHYYDIGIAVGAEEGLVVPVLREADRMSFAEIEQAIKAFADKAKSATLSLDDLRGGTFTLTNGGVFGSLLSTPILNPPQVGILGLHKIEERPIARAGQVVIRPMMYVALSYDHRVVDGREAVQFLVRVKELMEDPETLLFEG